ncbi:MAG: class I SAM-dependent methyltransferase [Solirubrobacteraceae bacterium]
MREVRQPHAGPGWSELASSRDGYAAVLDPGDRVGAKNTLIDRVHRRVLARVLSPLAGMSVVDFGCGTGRLTEWMAAQGADVTGVDVTREMLQRARAAVPRAHFYEIDGFSLPLEAATQDAIVSVYVLQYYVGDDDAMAALLSEFQRVLKPGGRVVAIEQASEGDIGRGASISGYRDALIAAGYGGVSSRPVRLGDSRFTRWVERWPQLADRVSALPSLIVREAQRTPSSALTGERYADALFLAGV